MPRQRQSGIIDKDPQAILKASTLMLFASGQSVGHVARALDTDIDAVRSIIDQMDADARAGMIDLARRCKKCLGPAHKDPEVVRDELRSLGIGTAISPRYQHGIIGGPRAPGPQAQNYLIEFRRFSAAPGQPTDWIILAAWAFLTFEDREWAAQVWTRARGLPTSIDKRHWAGPNRPLKIVQFVRFD